MSSDGDDWENQLDSDNEKEEEKKIEEVKAKKAGFDDEDAVDTEELAKKKKEEAKKAAEEAAANARIKSTKKVDYDKIFNERQKKLGGETAKEPAAAANTKGMSKAAKGIIMEQEAESGLADQLFGGMDDEGPKVNLNTEKEYKEFGKKVSSHLYQGHAPYRIADFFKELSKDLPNNCDSKQIKKICDSMQSIYNGKLKLEKEEATGKKKKKPAALKGGGGKGYEMNNNNAMINDVMGDDDYGDEAGADFKKADEAEFDFM